MLAFGGFLLLAALIAGVVFVILTVISLIKKDGKTKKKLIGIAGSFIVFVVSLIIIGTSVETDTESAKEGEKTPVSKEEKKDKPTAEDVAAKKAEKEAADREKAEKAEADKKAKAEAKAKKKKEAEAKKKAEAEAKAKAEEEAKIAAEKEKAEKKANAQPIPYAQLIKNPDRHAGEYVKYKGEIVQIQESDNYTVIRLAVTQSSYGYDFNDVVWVEYPDYTDYVDGDIITVYGSIIGSHSYQSQAGWDITVPAMLADSFE